MDRCRFFGLLSSYIDGELKDKQRLELEEHIKTCVSCQKEVSMLKALSGGLKKWQIPELDKSFDRTVQDEIVRQELEKGEAKMKRKFVPILVPSGILAGVLVFLVVGSLWKIGYFKSTEPVAYHVEEKVVAQAASATTPAASTTQVSKVDSTLAAESVANIKEYEPYYSSSNMAVPGGAVMSARTAIGVQSMDAAVGGYYGMPYVQQGDFNTESYDRIYDNDYKLVANDPLSTFSIDVDTASYSNVRRFLNQNQLPPKDAVRIEELVNYFTYDYPDPQGTDPFSVTTEIAAAPWNKDHQLVLIGLQAKKIETKSLPKTNLVFLLDVSGSMQDQNKLPLVKSAFRLLVNQLRAEDKISIVVYAGAAGVVLDSASGNEKDKILQAIDNLQAGGSTAGGQGIQLAYEVAKKNLMKDGNNRVILATDGDFNIGVTDDGALTRMIEEKRDDGIFLSIFGFGMGNYKDSKMEKIADKGNGTLAYIDNMLEAKKVFVSQLAGTLFTVAKDVKIQVEFNPAKVKAYRLIGYENRMLENKDFNDDKKDAGEIGAGHTVTALYEIVPAGSKEEFPGTDPLKYQQVQVAPSNELLTVKLRYKEPDGDTSKLLAKTLQPQGAIVQPSENYNFATSVVEFGMILRDSKYKGSSTYDDVLARAKASKGKDDDGYRAEFIKLVELAQILDIKTK
jgi:Ca-activated chloride channel family protein